jgi:prepilin-type N-terminal cleavage/methylation domain-containing protein
MKRLNGFTLVELVITIAILGILVAIAIPNYIGGSRRCYNARAESEIRSLKNSLESFFIDNNQYLPMNRDQALMDTQYSGLDKSDPSAPTIDIAYLAIGDVKTGKRLCLTTPVSYISSIPFDPFNGDGSESSYGYGSDGVSYYIITSWGPDKVEGLGGKDGFDERDFTGSDVSDRSRSGLRGSRYVLADYKFDPSNGISSSGEIFSVGP